MLTNLSDSEVAAVRACCAELLDEIDAVRAIDWQTAKRRAENYFPEDDRARKLFADAVAADQAMLQCMGIIRSVRDGLSGSDAGR